MKRTSKHIREIYLNKAGPSLRQRKDRYIENLRVIRFLFYGDRTLQSMNSEDRWRLYPDLLC